MFRKPNTGKKASLSQYGLLDLPDPDEEGMDLSDDDIDLEAELAAISGETGGRPKRKPVAAPTENLDSLIAASLKDIPSDDEVSDTGDDEDPDPELLNELKELAIDDEATPPPVPTRSTRPAPPPPGTLTPANSTITLLQERIANYTQAEKNAKENGESSRARRFNRGLKTLNDLLKQAKAGKQINEDDIPLPATISKPKDPQSPPPDPVEPPPVDPESSEQESHSEEPPSLPEPDYPPPSAPTEDQSVDPSRRDGLLFILKRKEEFKKAALEAKQAGDKPLALAHLKVVKQFDIVVDAYKSGQEMDLQELPTPEGIASEFSSQQKTEDQHQSTPEPAPVAEPTGLITASTVEEALKQRLEGFQKVEAKAKADGDMPKARRTGRILKQYQEAIKLHSMGKPLDLEELPPLAGYAPFPTDGNKPSPATPRTPAVATSRYHKQIALLQQRQKQFKEAALKSKRADDLDKAREYLRLARGFDSIIEAAKGGLIVDLNTLPLPPSQKDKLEQAFDVVTAEDCQPVPGEVTSPSSSSDEGDVLSRLQQQLSSQLKLCVANRDHYRALGNVAETNRFEHLALTVKQDIDVVEVAKSLGQSPPKFHYENKNFAIVQCNTDLNENDLELTIVRGISYNVPNPREVDTYVKFEFPFPQESPVSDRTALVKDTNSPQYDAVFPLTIARKARPCLRVFKRHAIKLEVYSRGGWFSRDTLLGTTSVKLAHLETHCTLHDAFPLMDGRRPAGGSLEVKLRVRTPLLQQQVDNTTHRWLVIDN